MGSPMLTRSALPLACLVALTLFLACSNQGEGEICNLNAGNGGNDDCQSGLICIPSPSGDTGARCCPSDRTQAKTAVCSVSHPGVSANPAPPDAGSEDSAPSSADAATDVTTDAVALEGSSPDVGADAADGSAD